ncbi:hypothetical protein [Nocardia paucivorans]|uniref:hypothetical protein n=1 Tax=Nocardia paucivorans TaxID=114259 RepID=UPI0002EE77E2|nr:hypothetical protein [Nocardia paucivorans]
MLGVGLASGIIDAQAMHQVDENQVGMAAGMLNTVRGTTNALILGLFGSALITILTGKIGSSDLAGQVATGNLPDTADAAGNRRHGETSQSHAHNSFPPETHWYTKKESLTSGCTRMDSRTARSLTVGP